MRFFKTLTICIFSLPLLAFSGPYDLKDLLSLKQEKNYSELLLHAKDIRPSKRDKAWKEMVTLAASEHLKGLQKIKRYGRTEFKLIERLALWPTLRKNSYFQLLRDQYSLYYINNCIKKKSSHCLQDLFSYWHSSTKSAKMALFTTQTVRALAPQMNVWPFLVHLTKDRHSKSHCSKAMVQEESIKHFKRVILLTDSSSTINSKISQNMARPCFSSILPSIKELLFNGTQVEQNLSYKILSARKALSKEDKDLFLTLYLLQGPMVGDTFNHAWAHLKKLGQNHTRRTKLLEKLKTFTHLPDSVFDHADKLKSKTIFNLFRNNFPEYLKFYAITCVQFLNGEKESGFGNPTINCPKFFALEKKSPVVSQTIRSKFSSIKKN